MPERVDVAVATLRRFGTVPLVLRGVVLASAVVAIVATVVPAWDVPDGYMYIAGLAAVIGILVPDSGAWFFVAAAIVVGWTTGAEEQVGVGPAIVITALALLAGHVASALAAAMPVTAAAHLGLVLRWWRPTAVLTTATVAAAVLVGVLDAWGPPGSIVLVLGALGVVGVAVWWWSSGTDEVSGS